MNVIHKYLFGEFNTEVLWFDKDCWQCDSGTLPVFDGNTRPLIPCAVESVIIPAGEKHKNWDSVATILKHSLESGLDRQGTIIGIGGGVICDMAAFAASLYMRGCRLELCPTTLLAMVDASLGGKTGIDFESYKNSVGTFYPASRIHIDPRFLSTLPEREYRSGLAEVIKTAMLGDRELYLHLTEKKDEIAERDPEIMKDVIRRCIQVKGRIVEEDLKERGVRAHLNLGHTFGHALETVTNFAVSHGEAVAWGIGKAMEMGLKLGLTDQGYASDVKRILNLYGFDLNIKPPDFSAYLNAMKKDKKMRTGKMRFILQKELLAAEIVEAEEETVLEIIK